MHLGECIVAHEADRKDGENLLNIAVAPNVAIPGATIWDFAGTKGERWRSEEAKASKEENSRRISRHVGMYESELSWMI